MFLFFQIFDRFVNIVKNFNPDDAQNVRKRLRINILNFFQLISIPCFHFFFQCMVKIFAC